MKIVIAPDSFKGSLTALEVCHALRDGAARVVPDAEFVLLPMADGGEGTTAALVAADHGDLQFVEAMGPLPSDQVRVTGSFGLIDAGRTAVLEMACVSGLPLVPKEKRNPLFTTSYGTGELIRAALDSGARHLLIGIGGSATNDLGTGMAQALGVRFFRADGREIAEPMTGALLPEISGIDMTDLHPAVEQSCIEVACDVDNPVLGSRGCATVYGLQKGASPAIVQELENSAAHALDIIETAVGRKIGHEPGAGAAGGLGAALLAFLGGRLRPGVQIILDAVGFADKTRGANLVLTGEGRIDSQTANGKTVSGVARTARLIGVPVVAIVGSIGDGVGRLYEIGLTSAFTLVPGPMSLNEVIGQSSTMISDTAERVLRLFVV